MALLPKDYLVTPMPHSWDCRRDGGGGGGDALLFKKLSMNCWEIFTVELFDEKNLRNVSPYLEEPTPFAVTPMLDPMRGVFWKGPK